MYAKMLQETENEVVEENEETEMCLVLKELLISMLWWYT